MHKNPMYADLDNNEIFLIAYALYNNTIHSATGLKPREILHALKDGHERRNRDLLYHNKHRDPDNQ